MSASMSGMTSVSVVMRLIMAVSATGAVSLVHHNIANAASESQTMQSQFGEVPLGLGFGHITPHGTAGTFTVDETGSVTVTGSHNELEDHRAIGAFNVIGSAGQYVTMSLPSSGFTIKHANGIDEMNIALEALDEPSMIRGNQAKFNIGGTLALSPYQTPGVYVGDYIVTVIYS